MKECNRRDFLARSARGLLGSLAAAGMARHSSAAPSKKERPNILWLIAEDMGPQLGCYGTPLVRTPNLDRLAREGALFTNAFTTAPVCSPSRSAFMTGMYQTRIGAHDHRSHRDDGYRLPDGVRLLTDHFRAAGYFTANVRTAAPGVKGTRKTDFNFYVERPFDGRDWAERAPGQPFFAQINFREAHRGGAWPEARKQKYLVDPAKVTLPPYYPDHPVVRDDFANYLDAIDLLDKKIGAVIKRLEDEGLLDKTIIFFFGDNGRCHIRGKQWLYDAGIRVPLIVRAPGVTKPGTVSDQLVSAIDIAAASLKLAGIEPPANMDGRVFLGPGATERKYIFAARDRCDETVDRIRCVRTKRYKYILNLMPERPYTQKNRYIETNYPTLGVMKELYAQGKLNREQALFLAKRKPDEELYDIIRDPDEVHNLANSPEHQDVKAHLRRVLLAWIVDTRDKGMIYE